MRSIIALTALLTCCSACSFPSLPSLPSLPWSGSSLKADPTAEALYDEGIRAFNDKKYVRAIDNFSKIRTDHPFSPMITQVELKVADAYYLNQQFPDAITAFKEFQSMHPTNENIPFVTLRLGQAHFDQFTSADRDQKNTEIAKGYFETVVSKYPNSPQAAEAKEKLAKCLDYLAEHEFNVAHFYYQQEKYPAARDRFEEIVRKYKDTPTAVKSLFYLGESYRNEKNGVRAALAYEALVQYYPQSKFAAEAQSQLATIEKEKRDPLALLLMRDRRPTTVAPPEVNEDPALAKLRDLNLVAKTDVVHEEPGDEKGLLRRVADKLNPFSSSSDDGKKDEKKSESALALVSKRNQAQKQESGGIMSALWPFGTKTSKETAPNSGAKSSSLVTQLDDSLKQKGIDVAVSQATLTPPPADLPKEEETPKPQSNTDTAALLGSIDANLKKSGTNGGEMPPPPEPAQAFKDVAATQERLAKAAAQSQSPQDVQTSGILSSIDQKLKAQGVEPARFEKPPTAEEIKAAAAQQKSQAKNVELEPKLAKEKGPLFLSPTEVPAQEKPDSSRESIKSDSKNEGGKDSPSRVLVKGPVPAQPAALGAKPAEPKKPSANQDDEPKGVLDQMRQDIENASKVLNPFRW